MKNRVVIESPYAGDVERNMKYGRDALRHSLLLGEAPIASHLLHTQVLDDTVPEERKIGMEAGWAWLDAADLIAFYVNYGMSGGMRDALRRVTTPVFGPPIVFRYRAPSGRWLENSDLKRLGRVLMPLLPKALWDDFVTCVPEGMPEVG